MEFIEIVNKVDINMIFFKFVVPNEKNNVHKIDLAGLKAFLLEKKIKCSLSPNYGDINRFVTHHYIG